MSNSQETFTRGEAHAMIETLRAQSHLELDDYHQLHEWNDDDAFSATELVRVARIGQLTCGHLATPRDGGLGTGFARTSNNHRLCYPCANIAQRAEFAACKPGDRFTGYNSDGFFTDWTARGIGRGYDPENPNDDGRGMMLHAGSAHPWSRERFYVSARDYLGRNWYGTSCEGMWTTLKLAKH